MSKFLKILSLLLFFSFNTLLADDFSFKLPEPPKAPSPARRMPASPASTVSAGAPIEMKHDVKKMKGKKDYAHIHIVLDGSGSMCGFAEFVKGAFKAFVDQQKKLKGEVTFTVWIFTNNKNVKIAHFEQNPSLDNYTCGGGTPWSESTVEAISDLEASIESLSKTKSNPESVIFAWITDGIAKVFPEAKALIDKHIEEWNYVLLGIGERSANFGLSGIGLPKENCFNILVNNQAEVVLVWKALNEFAKRSRGL